MLSWLLLIAVLLVLIVLCTWAWSATFGWFDGLGTVDEDVDVVRSNRKAVKNDKFDDLEFDVVGRGYRQDQVDDVIESLTQKLEEAEARLAGAGADAATAVEGTAKKAKAEKAKAEKAKAEKTKTAKANTVKDKHERATVTTPAHDDGLIAAISVSAPATGTSASKNQVLPEDFVVEDIVDASGSESTKPGNSDLLSEDFEITDKD